MTKNRTDTPAVRTQELSYLNYLRFGAILMVLLLHSLSGFLTNPHFFPLPSYKLILIFNEIGRAGVPLFFMMSGYLLLRDPRTADCIPFYKRRLSRILIPLVIWNAVYSLCYRKDIVTFFKESLVEGCAYHLWFLYTLLAIYLLAPFLKMIADHAGRKQLWWLLILICFAGTLRPLVNLLTPLYLYLFPSLVDGYLGYFLFGYLLGTSSWEGKKVRLPALLAIAAGLTLGAAGNFLLSSPEQMTLPFNSGYALNHYLIAGGIFLLVRTFRWTEGERARTLGKLLSALTFQIYFVHVLAMERAEAMVPDSGPILTILLTFVLTAAASVLFSLALYGASRFVKTRRRA